MDWVRHGNTLRIGVYSPFVHNTNTLFLTGSGRVHVINDIGADLDGGGNPNWMSLAVKLRADEQVTSDIIQINVPGDLFGSLGPIPFSLPIEEKLENVTVAIEISGDMIKWITAEVENEAIAAGMLSGSFTPPQGFSKLFVRLKVNYTP